MNTTEPSQLDVRQVKPLHPVAIFLATGAYTGYSPVLPGTVGSLLGLVLAFGLEQIPSFWLRLFVLAALWGVSVPICTAMAKYLRVKDPNAIVLDEILALPVALWGLNVYSWRVLAAAFVIFRIFDITKPPPIRWFERLPRGLGIMADDLVAGMFTYAALRLLMAAGLL